MQNKASVRTSIRSDFRLSVLLILAIFIGVNYISSFFHFRLDITNDRLYTLTEGTEKILNNIPASITLKYFFSSNQKETPQIIKNYGNNVREILEEYQRINPDRIKLEVINPLPDTDAEEWAERYGVTGVQDFSLTEKFYMGLVVINETKETVIPFMDPRKESSLEYDISKAIFEVTKAKSIKVGIYSSLPIQGAPANPYLQTPEEPQWVFYSELEKLYDSVLLNPQEDLEIPADINLVVVIHPFDFGPAQEYALDQFLVRGGKLIVLTDPNMVLHQTPAAQQGAPSASSLPLLFKKWGITYDKGQIVGDMNMATNVRSQSGQPVTFGLWLSVSEKMTNADAQVMNGMANLFFPYAGGLGYQDTGSGLRFTPLISTSSQAKLIDGFAVSFLPPEEINKQVLSGNETFVIAGMLSGNFSSAFTKPPQPTGDTPYTYTNPFRAQSDAESSVIIISDADFAANQFSVSAQNFFGNQVAFFRNNNIPLLLNLVDFSSGSTDLTGIRSRGNFLRTFTVFDDIGKAAQAKYNSAEEELKAELANVEEMISRLQPEDQSGQIQLSKDVVDQVKQFKDKELETKKQLREIRSLLRQDIDRLKNILIALNLFLVPFVVITFGVVVYFRRIRHT